MTVRRALVAGSRPATERGRRRRAGERGAVSKALVAAIAAVGGAGMLAYGGVLPSVSSWSGGGAAKGTDGAPSGGRAFGELPMSFEANQGQTDGEVRFLAHGSGYTMVLTPTEAVLSLAKPATGGGAAPSTEASVVRMKLLGGNPDAKVEGRDGLPGKANYFTGSDRSQWRTGVPTFGKVHYTGVYPGIDMVYYGSKSELEYDFVVSPGADPNQISLGLEGARSVKIDDAGDLLLTTADGTLRHGKPVLYQDVDGERRPVEGSFVQTADDRVGFKVGAYDTSRPLVIDPTLAYSTFLGGGGADVGFGITVDAAGNAYVAGQTTSSNFPTSGNVTCSSTAFPSSSLQCDRPAVDAFVTKLNASGTGLVYSTYLGGGRSDIAYRVAIDAAGSAYVAGATDSADDPGTTAVEAGFPTTVNAFDTTCGTDGTCDARGVTPIGTPGCPAAGCPSSPVADSFLSKLSPGGDALLYSTFLGGSNADQDVYLTAVGSPMGIAVSGTRAYVTGYTTSGDFPTTASAYQSTCGTAAVAGCDEGRSDAYFAVLDTALVGSASLAYSSYLGGTGAEQALSVAVNSEGDAFVTGVTSGYGSPLANNFPTKSAYQASYGGGSSDAFVAQFRPNRSGAQSVKYSTYLGGGGFEVGWGIAVEGTKAYVTGQTDSGDDPATPAADGPTPYFPTTTGAYDTTYNGRRTDSGGDNAFYNGDAFVTKFNQDGTTLAYSTFLGGNDMDVAAAIDVDEAGNAYIAGYTTCENTDPDGPGNLPCTGSFPVTAGAIQSTMDGGYLGWENHNAPTDIFLTKLQADGVGLVYSTYLGGNDFDRAFAVAVRDRDVLGNAITPEAYVTGRMASTDYPTTAGAFQSTKPAGKGNRDAAISKVVG